MTDGPQTAADSAGEEAMVLMARGQSSGNGGPMTLRTVTAVPAVGSTGITRVLPPIAGGQGTPAGGLGLWKAGSGGRTAVSARDTRVQAMRKLHHMTQTTQSLRHSVHRVETMIGLLGQLMYMLLDPKAAPPPAAGGFSAAGLSGMPQPGLPLGGGMAGYDSPAAAAGAGAPNGSTPPAASPPVPGNEGMTIPVGGDEAQKLQALMPLLTQLGGKNGLSGKLATVISSPLFQQLLSGTRTQ